MKFIRPHLVLLVGILIGLPFTAQNQQFVNESQIDEIFESWNSDRSPGLAVGIVSKGEVILLKGYGMANLEYDQPITSASVFDIASLSKQFTGMAIRMLVEEGKLSVEDDIHKYLPDFPDYGYTITIAHLLHHTSGIRDWPTLMMAAGYQFDDVLSFNHIISMIYSQKELNFVPGDEYVYSNSNYNLLVQILEKVTGDTFDNWTKKNLFSPLGMKDTHFHIDHRRLVKNKVDSYAPAGSGLFLYIPNNLCAVGSSSLYTSIMDFSKWMINLGTAEVGGRKAIQALTESTTLNDGSPNYYGYGLVSDSFRGRPIWTHSGSWAGFRTFMSFMPEQDFGVVVLSNLATVNPLPLSTKVMALYYPEVIADKSPENKSSKDESFNPYQETRINPNIFEKYEGIFEMHTQPAFTIEFTRERGNFYAEVKGQPKRQIYPSSDTTFFLKEVQAYVSFQPSENGEVNNVTLYQNRTIKGERILDNSNPFDPSSVNLGDYEGRYSSEELRVDYDLKQVDNKLVIDDLRSGRLTLNSDENDLFRAFQFPAEFRFERNDLHDVVAFRLSMMPRTRNILFTKVEEETYPVGQIITPFGEMLFTFYEETPKHKSSFIKMAEDGYWDSLCFNRVIENFVIQGGCPDTKEGFADSPYLIEPEFNENLKHIFGAVGMGRDENPEKISAGCQFYIVHAKEGLPRLDGKYMIFGQVFKGLDVLDKIAKTETDQGDSPVHRVGMDVNIIYLTTQQIKSHTQNGTLTR